MEGMSSSRNNKLRAAQARRSTGRRCHHLARLLRSLVISIVVVSGTCWMHQFVNCGAARRKYDAAMEVVETLRDKGRTCSVWFDHGGGTGPRLVGCILT